MVNFNKIFLLLIILSVSSFAQRTVFYGGGIGNVYAADLDGSTEFMSNSSPVNLDLNGDNFITTLARNSTFEDNATDWATNGNHTVSVTAASPIDGVYSLLISASGAGDASTNFASLGTAYLPDVTNGLKNTIQMKLNASVDCIVTVKLGSKTTTWSVVAAAGTFVFNIEATAGEVGQDLILYTDKASDVRVDLVDLSEAYDMTIMAWAKTANTGSNLALIYYRDADAWWQFYRSSSNTYKVDIKSTSTNLTLGSSTAYTTDVWRLVGFTFDRIGLMTVYVDAIADGASDFTSLGRISNSADLNIGKQSSIYWNGLVGETQIIRGQILTASEILAAYNRGRIGKHFLETGNEVGWYRFKGNDNTQFLRDETGNNDLTGVNVTQSDDQLKLRKYKD